MNVYQCSIGIMVEGQAGQRWLRATVELPCVPRIGDWIHVKNSTVVVERIELSDAQTLVDVIAKSLFARTVPVDELVENCGYTEENGWT